MAQVSVLPIHKTILKQMLTGGRASGIGSSDSGSHPHLLWRLGILSTSLRPSFLRLARAHGPVRGLNGT